jgi:hypothetical protein
MKMRVSESSILSKLPVKMQNQLLNARKSAIYDQTMSIRNFIDSRKRSPVPIEPDHFNHSQSHNQYKKMKFTPQQWAEIARSTADPVLDSKKEKVLYLEVPTPTVAVRIDAISASACRLVSFCRYDCPYSSIVCLSHCFNAATLLPLDLPRALRGSVL